MNWDKLIGMLIGLVLVCVIEIISRWVKRRKKRNQGPNYMLVCECGHRTDSGKSISQYDRKKGK